jgi:hypothetical protein
MNLDLQSQSTNLWFGTASRFLSQRFCVVSPIFLSSQFHLVLLILFLSSTKLPLKKY